MRHAPNVRANAWEDVSDLVASFGLILDEWQEDVLQAALGERADGRWAARQIGLSTPRQNGKTHLIVARVLAGLLLFDERIIIVSAHRQDTARETFFRLVQIIEDNPGLEARVDFIARSEMREFIRMKSGQEVRFKARSSGAGRGFSCDCLMLDEAQILGSAAWSAILPTMSARPNPQVWLMGTPPTEDDDGEVFERLRTLGIEGREPRIAYLEWSADREDPITEVETWAKANPAYGTRIEHEAIATELASMSEEQFQMERLGIWPELLRHQPVFKPSEWKTRRSDGPAVGLRPQGLGVDMSHGLEISVCACWLSGDAAHIEEVWAGRDVAAAVAWITATADRDIEVVIDDLSPAGQMLPELRARKVKTRRSSGRDMAKGCGLFETRFHAGKLTHGDQKSLTDAVMGARKRAISDAGGWGWDRRDSTVAIHPVVSATLALLGATYVGDQSSADAFFL